MERSPAITSHAMRCECVPSGYAHHARTYVGMRTRRHARRSHLIARASSVDGALERIVAWTALDVENKRTLNDGVPDAIQRDIDELVANGNVDGEYPMQCVGTVSGRFVALRISEDSLGRWGSSFRRCGTS